MSGQKFDPRFTKRRDESIRLLRANGTPIKLLMEQFGLGRSQVYAILGSSSGSSRHPYVGPDRDALSQAWSEWRSPPDTKTDDWLQGLVDLPIPTKRLRRWEAPIEHVGVYFVQAESGGPVKIGVSTDRALLGRLAQLQGGNPELLVIRRFVDGGYRVEADLHARFADYRIRRSEWFEPVDEILVLLPSSGAATFSRDAASVAVKQS
jgi:hypothetical protein